MSYLRNNLLVYVLFVAVLTFSGCAKPNFDVQKPSSYALQINDQTTLGAYVTEWKTQHAEELSDFFPLKGGMDALGARLKLIDAAEESIDMQYFLMKDDVVGAMIAYKLLEAADRGVRIRFLLDDIFTTVKDIDLYVLNEHPNIEVRLFNPLARRGIWLFNYLGDFSRANRRMHNKSFSVDGSFTIVGGRNLAQEYFELDKNSEFYDLDVLAIGPIVEEIAENFDEFWNHSRSLPIVALKKTPSEKKLELAKIDIENIFHSEGSDIYHEAINSSLLNDLRQGQLTTFPAEAHLFSESPDKVKASTKDTSMRLGQTLGEHLLKAENEVIIVTPYFIPTKDGMSFWQQVVDSGIEVFVITNSLASTNHVPVHAAYERYRKDLLRMGIHLYETRSDATNIIQETDEASRSTLHTKLIYIDSRYIFIGSLNMDPRSVIINTEMGIMVDSEELAQNMLARRENLLEHVTYKLVLNDKDQLEWHGIENNQPVVLRKEPQTSWWKRFKAKVYKVLPEGQL